MIKPTLKLSPLSKSRAMCFSAVVVTCHLLLPQRACAASNSVPGLIPDRATLNSLLAGYQPVTESFEGVSLGNTSWLVAPELSYDSQTVFGTGLVVPGVTFRAVAAMLYWNGPGGYGLPSGDLVSTSPTIEIDFWHPTTAFGVDLLEYGGGYFDFASVNVYASDDTTLVGSFSGIYLSGPDNPVFFGFQDSSGIGKVDLECALRGWSPLIDNVTFGTVPEPSVGAILATAVGLLALTRAPRVFLCRS